MSAADTMSYDELVLEVEFVPDSGSYSRICGVTGVSITRSTNVTTTEVPDCDDETQPHSVKRTVRSVEVTASGTGVWAKSSHHKMLNWFYNALKLNARLRNLKMEAEGDTGEAYVESGPAILTTLSNERPDDKGEITASVEIQFDGTPALGLVA